MTDTGPWLLLERKSFNTQNVLLELILVFSEMMINGLSRAITQNISFLERKRADNTAVRLKDFSMLYFVVTGCIYIYIYNIHLL